jgi:transcriptional regulator with XRE-family HTH domain
MPSRLDRLIEWLQADRENIPNKLTLGMGKLIRQAREDAGLSQAELARRIYRRQASLSNIENGLMEASSSTLAYLSIALGKPITYFFPIVVLRDLEPEPRTPELTELLLHATRLSQEDIKGVTAQIRALADLQDSRLRARRRERAR